MIGGDSSGRSYLYTEGMITDWLLGRVVKGRTNEGTTRGRGVMALKEWKFAC